VAELLHALIAEHCVLGEELDTPRAILEVGESHLAVRPHGADATGDARALARVGGWLQRPEAFV
jgi:hypothetical protein